MKEFWKDTALRCLWTFAEAMLGFVTIGQAMTDISWKHALSVSAVAVIVCLIKQLGVYARNNVKEDYDD